jgi:hypothetical protein
MAVSKYEAPFMAAARQFMASESAVGPGTRVGGHR